MKYFQYYEDYDVTELRSALTDLGDQFGSHGQQVPAWPYPDAEHLFLTQPANSLADAGVAILQTQKAVAEVPVFHKAINYIVRLVGGDIGTGMIVKLKPNGQVKGHRDQGHLADSSERYHLPLHTNKKCWLTCETETVHFGLGEIWWFNKHMYHYGANYGLTDRIHLIVDVYGSYVR